MKNLVLAALLSIGMVGFAQNRGDKQKMTPEQRTEKQVERLTTELNLNVDQQKKVSDLLTTESAEMQKLRAERRNRTTKPSAAEREAIKKQMIGAKDVHNTKMKAILTTDQYTTFIANQEKKETQMRERMNQRKKRADTGDFGGDDND